MLSIVTVIGMAVFAMRFLRVDVGDIGAVLHRTFGAREKLQVLRVLTGAITANVVNNHVSRNCAKGRVVGDTVRAAVLSMKEEESVTVFIKTANPQMATARS